MAEKEYKITGLSPSMALMLLTINEEQGIQPGALAQELQLTPSTVTRLVDKLEGGKFVTRTVEGKKISLYSTAKGLALNQKIKIAWTGVYKKYSEIMGVEHAKMMTDLVYDTAQKLE